MALQSEKVVPAGAILMWHGLLSAIPAGWVLCDGANGTPDLRDKFVKGTSAGQNPGNTGGNLTHTHANHVQAFTGPANLRTGGAVSVFDSPTPITLTHDSPNHEPPYYAVAFIMKS